MASISSASEHATGSSMAEERLATELADVRASIELVSAGVATQVTLTGLRFGRQLAGRLEDQATSLGVELEVSLCLEDTMCDVHVHRVASSGGQEMRRG
jgi:hypothetical protein